MSNLDVGLTSPTLLRAVSDPRYHRDWREFRERYTPLMRECCRRYRLDEHAVDDVVQDAWVQVARRMRDFVYDPKKRNFRGWLWRVCQYSAASHLRRRSAEEAGLLGRWDEIPAPAPMLGDAAEDADEWAEHRRIAAEVQEAVRRRIEPHTWEAFRLFEIVGWKGDEVAGHLGIKLASVHQAKKRVLAMLREEGRNRLEHLADDRP
ncbi:RNA polymerase sigma factor [Paludisphaera rhizosphaerae]|uniref:RNA polymerase sigma factor n=1 Tax=Paludisphaera rhizosphaerae TaxID=2711216 RepID=UPI0013ECDCCF|nr:sigma-70 family RNA polymerase sigma factor [Paludisphaera rhizosphaerae]